MADILVGRGVRRTVPTIFDLISGPASAVQSGLGAIGSAAKGAAQATVGLPGDIESLVRMITGGEQTLPTTEQVSQFVNQYIRAPYPQYERLGEFTGLPVAGALNRPVTQLTNEAADAIVRAITRNPEATATGVIRETSMPFMQAVAPRTPGLLETPVKSELGFYSALEQATMPLQNKGTGAQFLAQIEKTAGVKPEEVKWTGLDEFLKSRQNVTKQEVQDYLAANRVNLQEVRLGGPQGFDANRLTQLEDEFAKLKQHPIDDPSFGEEKYNEMIRLMNIRDQSTTSDLYRQADDAMKLAQRAQARGYQETANNYFRQYELLNTRAEKLDLEDLGMANPPKFSQYTLPGGENYREILLTLPESMEAKMFRDLELRVNAGERLKPEELQKYYDLVDAQAFKGQYFGPHYEQPNILAHMRVNDRVVDGKKTLFIEEIQSDWHQAGRKKGYAQELKPEQLTAAEVLPKRPGPRTWTVTYPNGNTAIFAGNSADDAISAAIARESKVGVPDAPFKTTWHELTLKRAIQEASEKGYDQIAFTTGKTQAERYDLSKQVNKIDVEAVEEVPNLYFVDVDVAGRGKMNLEVENGVVRQGEFEGKPLEDVVGKEIAEKVFAVQQGQTTRLQGDDLRIGGEGMKGFYDQILPKTLDKLGKKFDAKVGKTEMDGVEVWAMNITPKMRESVLTKGQPLFAATPAVGLLGDENE